jgi:hypothetical protein
MSDTRARFLTAIADRLGADRIVELHLFSPIRQGVLETGVAVVAVEPARHGEEEGTECGAMAEAECSAEETADEGDVRGGNALAAATESVPTDAADPTPSSSHTLPLPLHHTLPLPLPENGTARLTVFTARYRLTRKGLDRGKWLFELAATADAPLATVDAVARGVTQRSKDLTESERLSGDQLRTLLGDPLWRTPK